MSFAALGISAVSSTTTGGLPAPAPIALFPEESAAVTTPGQPVAAIRAMSLCFIKILHDSSVGLKTVVTMFSGPPASNYASLTIFTAIIATLLEDG